ncbi:MULTISPECIES: hypothetical protein [Bacillaceae]|uniref:hypothetical protein n=1 Tax=Bacillaceae TaxID=186817 RepID=UPI0015DF59C8|nr:MULTISPECIES: hypothetical protein [Bacillaceae]QNG60699.1 hypothetical protein H4O14_04075 [Bacillus sp. PAMC26568]
MKAYRFPLILLSSVLLGGIIGLILGEKATFLKPFGDLFLNAMFTVSSMMVSRLVEGKDWLKNKASELSSKIA